MIRSLENVIGYQISATNGTMGTVSDYFLLDDVWRISYLVVSAGGWLDWRKVLLSTEAVDEFDDAKREVRVGITREMVYSSPDIDSEKPVTRQKEILLAKYYGWKPYWIPDPFLGASLPAERLECGGELEGSNPHLRSFRELTTYSVLAAHATAFVTDLIIDDENWKVESLVAAAGRGNGERAVLCPPSWIDRIIWRDRLMRVAAKHPDLGGLPVFDASAPINRRTVMRYFDYLGRPQGKTLVSGVEKGKGR